VRQKKGQELLSNRLWRGLAPPPPKKKYFVLSLGISNHWITSNGYCESTVKSIYPNRAVISIQVNKLLKSRLDSISYIEDQIFKIFWGSMPHRPQDGILCTLRYIIPQEESNNPQPPPFLYIKWPSLPLFRNS